MSDASNLSKKWKITLLSFASLILVAFGFWIKNQFSATLWIAWFSALDVLVGVYAGVNVTQKHVISKNYRKELDDK